MCYYYIVFLIMSNYFYIKIYNMNEQEKFIIRKVNVSVMKDNYIKVSINLERKYVVSILETNLISGYKKSLYMFSPTFYCKIVKYNQKTYLLVPKPMFMLNRKVVISILGRNNILKTNFFSGLLECVNKIIKPNLEYPSWENIKNFKTTYLNMIFKKYNSFGGELDNYENIYDKILLSLDKIQNLLSITFLFFILGNKWDNIINFYTKNNLDKFYIDLLKECYDIKFSIINSPNYNLKEHFNNLFNKKKKKNINELEKKYIENGKKYYVKIKDNFLLSEVKKINEKKIKISGMELELDKLEFYKYPFFIKTFSKTNKISLILKKFNEKIFQNDKSIKMLVEYINKLLINIKVNDYIIKNILKISYGMEKIDNNIYKFNIYNEIKLLNNTKFKLPNELIPYQEIEENKNKNKKILLLDNICLISLFNNIKTMENNMNINFKLSKNEYCSIIFNYLRSVAKNVIFVLNYNKTDIDYRYLNLVFLTLELKDYSLHYSKNKLSIHQSIYNSLNFKMRGYFYSIIRLLVECIEKKSLLPILDNPKVAQCINYYKIIDKILFNIYGKLRLKIYDLLKISNEDVIEYKNKLYYYSLTKYHLNKIDLNNIDNSILDLKIIYRLKEKVNLLFNNKLNKSLFIQEHWNINNIEIFKNPYYLFSRLKNDKNFIIWGYFLADDIKKLYNVSLSLSQSDIKTISLILYYFYNCKEQNLNDLYYIKLINICNEYNKLILYNYKLIFNFSKPLHIHINFNNDIFLSNLLSLYKKTSIKINYIELIKKLEKRNNKLLNKYKKYKNKYKELKDSI